MDKQKRIADEKFKQESWDQMKELLDREMPVEKKKNRSLLFFLFGLGFLFLISLFFFSTDKNSKLSPPATIDQVKKQVAESSITEKEKPSYTSNTNSDVLNQNASDQKTSNETQIKGTSDPSNLNALNTNSLKINAKSANEQVSFTLERESPLVQNTIKKETTVSSIIPSTNTDQIVPTKSFIRSDDVYASLSKKNIANISLLPLNLKSFDIPSTILELQSNTSTLNNIKPTLCGPGFQKNLDFLIGGNLIASTDTEFYGYGGHLGVDYQFSPKLSVRSMIARQETVPQNPYTISVSSLEESTIVDFDPSRLNVNDISKFKETSNLFNLSLAYDLNNQFSIFGGCQLRQFLGVREDSFPEAFNAAQETISFIVDISNISASEDLNNSSTAVFLREKRFYNPIIGFNYHKNILDASLVYEHGLKGNYRNLITGESSNPLSYIQLNLSARF